MSSNGQLPVITTTGKEWTMALAAGALIAVTVAVAAYATYKMATAPKHEE
jgi:hypothetical protein